MAVAVTTAGKMGPGTGGGGLEANENRRDSYGGSCRRWLRMERLVRQREKGQDRCGAMNQRNKGTDELTGSTNISRLIYLG